MIDNLACFYRLSGDTYEFMLTLKFQVNMAMKAIYARFMYLGLQREC